jgi:hypothetical protein
MLKDIFAQLAAEAKTMVIGVMHLIVGLFKNPTAEKL